MTLKVTQTFTRPSTDIPWMLAPAPEQIPGRLALDSSLSNDGLTQTIISIWTSQADWDARINYINNKNWDDQRIAHNIENNINSTVSYETI